MLLWREFASRHATASFAPTANCMSSNSYAIACASSDCNSNSVLLRPGEGRQLQLLLCTQVQASPDYNCMSSKRLQLLIVLWGMREDSNSHFKYLPANLIIFLFLNICHQVAHTSATWVACLATQLHTCQPHAIACPRSNTITCRTQLHVFRMQITFPPSKVILTPICTLVSHIKLFVGHRQLNCLLLYICLFLLFSLLH